MRALLVILLLSPLLATDFSEEIPFEDDEENERIAQTIAYTSLPPIDDSTEKPDQKEPERSASSPMHPIISKALAMLDNQKEKPKEKNSDSKPQAAAAT